MTANNRKLLLIKYKDDWHVCFKAKGKIEGRRLEAWLRNGDEAYICEVGQQQRSFSLPDELPTNFFDDAFQIAIEEVDSQDNRVERLGSVNNILAAKKAFDELVRHSSTSRIIMMRKGARIIEKERGLGQPDVVPRDRRSTAANPT